MLAARADEEDGRRSFVADQDFGRRSLTADENGGCPALLAVNEEFGRRELARGGQRVRPPHATRKFGRRLLVADKELQQTRTLATLCRSRWTRSSTGARSGRRRTSAGTPRSRWTRNEEFCRPAPLAAEEDVGWLLLAADEESCRRLLAVDEEFGHCSLSADEDVGRRSLRWSCNQIVFL